MSLPDLVIRSETPDDVAAVRSLNLVAFGQPMEADLVDALRASCDAALSLVAEIDGDIVGHILFTPATVDSPSRRVEGMALAPMAVHPSWQRRGIGSALADEGLRILESKGYPFVVVVGHAAYYPRFGFEPASGHGLSCPWPGVPDEAFMVIVVDPQSMEGVVGPVRYRSEFDTAL